MRMMIVNVSQATIEDSLGGELSFAVQPGDVVLGYFHLPSSYHHNYQQNHENLNLSYDIIRDSDTLARCTPPGWAARRGIHRFLPSLT